MGLEKGPFKIKGILSTKKVSRVFHPIRREIQCLLYAGFLKTDIYIINNFFYTPAGTPPSFLAYPPSRTPLPAPYPLFVDKM